MYDITLFVGVCLLIIILGTLIKVFNYFARPAKYCSYCGCSTQPVWHLEERYFDSNTGKGTEKSREYWVCSLYKDKGLERYKHYEFKGRKTKETMVASRSDC